MISFILFSGSIFRGHTRISCLPLLSVSKSIFVRTRGYRHCLSFLIGSIFILLRSCQTVTCWHTRRSYLRVLFFIALVFVIWRSCQTVTFWHTRRSCLPLFSSWFDLCYITLSSDCSLLAHKEIVIAFLFWLVWSLFVRLFLVGSWGDSACLSFLIGLIFVCQINTFWHTRRSCLPFFSNWFDFSSMTFLSYCSLLAQEEIVLDFLLLLVWSSF